jgi:hypothetical protein
MKKPERNESFRAVYLPISTQSSVNFLVKSSKAPCLLSFYCDKIRYGLDGPGIEIQ